MSYTPVPDKTPAVPNPATVAPKPADIKTNEELYLHGIHLEQYRHATCRPEPYLHEASSTDPLDSRSNNALGLILYRQGQFQAAELLFRTAISGLTQRNSNPYDGEPFYNLGLSLKIQGKYKDAFDAFYKAVWNAAWQDAGYFELARLASRSGAFEEALDFTRRSLRRNYVHHKARHLRIALLRRLGRKDAALREASLALELDRMEFGALWERYLLIQDDLFTRLSRQNQNTLIEIALDYIHAGLFLEATALLRRIPHPGPMVMYFLGWCLFQDDDKSGSLEAFREAEKIHSRLLFPEPIRVCASVDGCDQ